MQQDLYSINKHISPKVFCSSRTACFLRDWSVQRSSSHWETTWVKERGGRDKERKEKNIKTKTGRAQEDQEDVHMYNHKSPHVQSQITSCVYENTNTKTNVHMKASSKGMGVLLQTGTTKRGGRGGYLVYGCCTVSHHYIRKRQRRCRHLIYASPRAKCVYYSMSILGKNMTNFAISHAIIMQLVPNNWPWKCTYTCTCTVLTVQCHGAT